MIKKLFLIFLIGIMLLAASCANNGFNGKKDGGVIESPNQEEIIDSESASDKEDSGDDTSAPEEEDETEENDWTFIY